MIRKSSIFFLSCFFLLSCPFATGDMSYPAWKEGEMEIHHIYTGRGESNFMVFPDGTTMLIDAGDWDPDDYPKMCELLPDSTQRAGEWIARYVKYMNPNKECVDYLMVSHFHNDHTGDSSNPACRTSGRNPDYVLTGIPEAGETLRFGTVFDRGYPDYNYPLPIVDPDVTNYRAFLNWQSQQFGLQQKIFKTGQKDQIALKRKPKKYRGSFSIMNLAANGEIWSGKENGNIRYYDLNQENLSGFQNENTKSLAIRISYGPFRYYTGGDISGCLLDSAGNSVDLEEKVAEACGPVDVCKANHHAYKDAMSDGFVWNIQARNYVISTWDYEHTQPEIFSRMVSEDLYAGKRNVFSTYIPEFMRKAYADEEWMRSVCPENGHVVVKVYDKGRKYKIYILSATEKDYNVKAIYGPFESGKGMK